jgi:hypothetical protein
MNNTTKEGALLLSLSNKLAPLFKGEKRRPLRCSYNKMKYFVVVVSCSVGNLFMGRHNPNLKKSSAKDEILKRSVKKEKVAFGTNKDRNYPILFEY